MILFKKINQADLETAFFGMVRLDFLNITKFQILTIPIFRRASLKNLEEINLRNNLLEQEPQTLVQL